MANQHPPLTDDQIDAILRAAGERLEVPRMADAAARARARIEARARDERASDEPVTVIPFPADDPAPSAGPAAPIARIERESRSRLREIALFAAGIVAAVALAALLSLVFRGFGGDSDGDQPGTTVPDGPLALTVYDIPGFEFVRAIGQPRVPNQPVDVAVGPDGTIFVLDTALDQVIAFTPEGEIRTAWGNEGFSRQIRGAASVGAGLTGEIYVVADQVYVLDPDGRQTDAWPIPEPSDAEAERRGTSSTTQRVAIDSSGNVYVARRSTIWKYEPAGGSPAAIDPGMGEGSIQVQVDGQDQLYAASAWDREIRLVNPDGTTDLLVTSPSDFIFSGFTVAPDGSILLFVSSPTGGSSTFIRFDRRGEELARWQMDRAGIFIGSIQMVGIAVKPDGTIILPDPLANRLALYDADGTFISEIVDDDPTESFGFLWRLAVDGEGNVFAYDPSLQAKMLKLSADGDILQSVPLEYDSFRIMSGIVDLGGLVATENGGFIIAIRLGNRVVVYSPDGEPEPDWGEMDFQGRRDFMLPMAIALDEDGFLYLVDESGPGNLKKFTFDGEFVNGIGTIASDRVDIAYHDGAVWAADGERILRYPADGGEPLTVASTALGDDADGVLPGLPYTLALDSDGNIYTYMLAPSSGQSLFGGKLAKLDPDGNLIWAVELAENADNLYVDLAIAPDGTLYLADSEQRRILAYRPTEEADAAEPSELRPTAEPMATYEPAGEVPDLLVVEKVETTEGSLQFGIYDPAGEDLVELLAGELVGISQDGRTLLLIDQEPGDERLRLDLIAVSTETFEELWRTDIGELAESRPNTIYFNTAVSGDTVYVAIHDPDYRLEMLEIAPVRLSDGFMQRYGAVGMDTDVSGLSEASVEVVLLASPPGSAAEVTSFIRAPEEGRTTVQSILGVGYDHRLTELAPVEPGQRYLLPGGDGLINIPSNGFTTNPAVQYVMFHDMTTGRIELPFDSVEETGTVIVEYALFHDGRTLYALSPYDEQIAIIDLTRLEISSVETLVDATPPASLPDSPDINALQMLYSRQPLTISPDGRYIFALGTPYELNGGYTPGIWKIDTRTWTVVDEAAPGGSWANLSIHSNYDGSQLYVSLGLQWPSSNASGGHVISQPGMLVMDTESFDDQTGLIDLDGYRIVGTLADFYRDFHGRSPAVVGMVPR